MIDYENALSLCYLTQDCHRGVVIPKTVRSSGTKNNDAKVFHEVIRDRTLINL